MYTSLFGPYKISDPRPIDIPGRVKADTLFDICYIHEVHLDPVYRGHRIGLFAANQMVRALHFRCDIFVLHPGFVPGAIVNDPEERAAVVAKLTRYWARMGFEEVVKHDIPGLAALLRLRPKAGRPAIETVVTSVALMGPPRSWCPPNWKGESEAESQRNWNRMYSQIKGEDADDSSEEEEERPVCGCGVPAERYHVVKDTENKGRPYYACDRSRFYPKCSFFQWEKDEYLRLDEDDYWRVDDGEELEPLGDDDDDGDVEEAGPGNDDEQKRQNFNEWYARLKSERLR